MLCDGRCCVGVWCFVIGCRVSGCVVLFLEFVRLNLVFVLCCGRVWCIGVVFLGVLLWFCCVVVFRLLNGCC